MSDIDLNQLASNVGRAIARQRQRCQLTQEEVAERLGVGYEAVSRIERGIVMPTVARLLQLAQIFDCNASELLSEASVRPSDQAQYLTRRLAALSEADRILVITLLDTLVPRLSQR